MSHTELAFLLLAAMVPLAYYLGLYIGLRAGRTSAEESPGRLPGTASATAKSTNGPSGESWTKNNRLK